MARRHPKPRDSRDRILTSALALFGERGYATTSVDDIAARAGLTKGALYYYFTDKADIARDLHHDLWVRLKHEAMRSTTPGGDTCANLRHAFDTYLVALQHLPEAHFFLRQFWAVPALDAVGRFEHEAALGFVKTLLEEGIRRGDIVALDPTALGRALIGVFSEATLHVLTTQRTDEAVAVVHRMIDALDARRGLIATGRGAKRTSARRRAESPVRAG